MEEEAAAAPCLPSHSPRVRAAPVRVVARICPGGDPAGSFQVAARVPDPANPSSASVSFVPIIKEATPSISTPSGYVLLLFVCLPLADYFRSGQSTKLALFWPWAAEA